MRRRGVVRRFLAFVGPAYLVGVGYMDPGNWATDIEAGSKFGYSLLWVLLVGNLAALLLQTMAARFGIVTGLDLAQGCRREFHPWARYPLWIMAEIAIAATDLAEALGTILGLKLLFGLPLLWGCALAALDTLLFIMIQRLGVRKMEAAILALVGTIGACFVLEVVLSPPDWRGVVQGFRPRITSSEVYIVTGILGAIVMPHNLFLHSALVQSRAVSNTITGKAEACRYNFYDSLVALNLAFLVNVAIYIMAVSNFHTKGIEVTQIEQAHDLLSKLLGEKVAPVAFAIALLASGQSSTITGTIAGQVVMEGFLDIRLRPWLRRLITRCIALLPAVVAIYLFADKAAYQLLIWSQVILSLQLPFTIFPLLQFTSDRRKMGIFVNKFLTRTLAWFIAAVIVLLNLKLVCDQLSEWSRSAPGWVWLFVGPLLAGLAALLLYVVARPLFRRGECWESGVEDLGRQVAAHIQPSPAFRHIGVALERTEGDARVLSRAISMAHAHGNAKITLLHVVDTPGALVYGSESKSLHGVSDGEYLEQLTREVEERDLPVEFALGYGRVVPQIIALAKESGIDLLVMGAHGHGMVGDLLHGETADSVRHVLKIPVLIVREN